MSLRQCNHCTASASAADRPKQAELGSIKPPEKTTTFLDVDLFWYGAVSSTLPRLGLLATLGYYVSGMLDAQLIAVNGKAEKPSYRTSWPKCSKSITMCRSIDSQNSLLHCPQRKVIKIASSSAHTNGSRASEHFVAESLEGRRTHTRSVIVTTNGEKCGHWIQICENTRRYVVFIQSAAKHRKSLIFNK